MKTINITHPDKLLFPSIHVSKQDVIDYYEHIADYFLPYVKKRPLTLKQYPNGVEKKGFYHKRAPSYFPDFIHRINIPMRQQEKSIQMVSIDNITSLIYLANQDAIEFHMGLSTAEAIEKPDQIIFDFDPSDNDFEKVRAAALALKEILDDLNLPNFVKTTGSRGVHIHIPIVANMAFQQVKEKTKTIAEKLHDLCPAITTLELRKEKRGNRVFIDYLRNDYGMTAIAPYSLRAQKNAAIATPISWKELNDKQLGPQRYTIKNIFRRLGQKEDPWEKFNESRVKFS